MSIAILMCHFEIDERIKFSTHIFNSLLLNIGTVMFNPKKGETQEMLIKSFFQSWTTVIPSNIGIMLLAFSITLIGKYYRKEGALNSYERLKI